MITPSKNIKPNIKFDVLAVACLVLITVAVYGRSLNNSFVWDDHLLIVRSNFIKSWKNFPAIFSAAYLTSAEDAYLVESDFGSGEVTYRPVVTATYFLDYALWKLNAFGYHLTNLVIHIVNVILLYVLAKFIIKNQKWSLLAAAVFAIHPVPSEAVYNISFREELLAFFFFLLSLILFIKMNSYAGRSKKVIYSISLASFSLALFSKEMAITLPIILVLYDYYFVYEKGWGSFLRRFKSYYVGYIMVSVFYLWIWFFVMPSKNELIVLGGLNAYKTFLTMAKIFGIYIFWLFIPIGIHATIPDASIFEHSFFTPGVVASILLIVGCIFYAFKLRRQKKIVSFAIFWFFITLLPVSNVISIQNIMASRYLYIPMVGFCLLIAFFFKKIATYRLRQISPRFLQKALVLSIVGLVVAYSVSTVIRGFTWKNGHTFFMELEAYYPHKSWVHKGLATSYFSKGMWDEAICEYKQAKELNPFDFENHESLGRIYLMQGNFSDAEVEFSQVIKHDPQRVEAYSYFCKTLQLQGKHREATTCLKELRARFPENR